MRSMAADPSSVVCTKSCHMGIDVMSYAVQGMPMDDVQCVRCSACVVNCPTDVLSFGRLDADDGFVPDSLHATLFEPVAWDKAAQDVTTSCPASPIDSMIHDPIKKIRTENP